MNDEFARRFDTTRQIPEERAIAEAHRAVEALGAHPLLTTVSDTLLKAKTELADWHDAGRPGAYAPR